MGLQLYNVRAVADKFHSNFVWMAEWSIAPDCRSGSQDAMVRIHLHTLNITSPVHKRLSAVREMQDRDDACKDTCM